MLPCRSTMQEPPQQSAKLGTAPAHLRGQKVRTFGEEKSEMKIKKWQNKRQQVIPRHCAAVVMIPAMANELQSTTHGHTQLPALPKLPTPDTMPPLLIREYREQMFWGAKENGRETIAKESPHALNSHFVWCCDWPLKKFMTKELLKTSSSSLWQKLIFVSYNYTRPTERHKTVVSDTNPQVGPDPDLQVISVNQKQSVPTSYQYDVPLYLFVGIQEVWIKFDANTQT